MTPTLLPTAATEPACACAAVVPDLGRLHDALHALLSPPDADAPEAWRRGAERAVAAAAGASGARLCLPAPVRRAMGQAGRGRDAAPAPAAGTRAGYVAVDWMGEACVAVRLEYPVCAPAALREHGRRVVSVLAPALRAACDAWLRRDGPADAPSPPALAAGLSDAEVCGRFGLTRKQAVVARLLADGLTNQEIARRLHLSPYTVRNHAEQVMARMGVGNRARVGALLRTAAPARAAAA